MDNATLMYVVIGLLSVFFLVLIVFSAKRWGILHLMSAVFVFIAAGVFVWMSAATLRTQQNWRSVVNSLEKKVAAEELEHQKLLAGVLTDTEQTESSIRDVEARLQRVLLDRGRVWRNCPPQVGADSIILTVQPVVVPEPEAEAGDGDAGDGADGGDAEADGGDAGDGDAGDADAGGGDEPDAEAGDGDAADGDAGGADAGGGDEPGADAGDGDAGGGDEGGGDEGGGDEGGGDEGGGDEGDPEPDPPPVRRHDIEANSIVYGFLEGQSNLSGELKGHTVPTLYLGEFRVMSRTDTTVTLQPTLPLTPLQESSLAGGNWTMYDNMPVDANYAFAGLSEEDLKILFPRERMTISDAQYNARIAQLASYFDDITAAELGAKIPKSRLLMDDALYEQFVDQYVRDRQEADPAKDPPEFIWKTVSFKVPTSIQVDAVLADTSGSTHTQNFTPEAAVAIRRQTGDVVIAIQALLTGKPGDANLDPFPLSITVTEGLKVVSDWDIPELWDDTQTPPRLKPLSELTEKELDNVREAKSVSFDIADEALVHPSTAKFLVKHEVAEEVGATFVRPLKDYAVYFHDFHRQELLFEDSASVIKKDTITLVDANERAKEQETYRADERAKLLADREGFQREQAAITALAAQMESRLSATRQRMSQLYRTNLQLAEQIRAIEFSRVADFIKRERGVSPAPAGTDATLSAP